MKFDVEIVKQGRNTVTGNGNLRILQNNTMPPIDLLVRESIQNSLDAFMPNASTVDVFFNYDHFNDSSLYNLYPVIGDELKSRYLNKDNYFISISDKNTYGLTGSLDGNLKKDLKSQNLAKLVFHILEAQDKPMSGGSWGTGKTVYYRVGPGLVIYYSRILKDDGSYEERLVSSLVEDEKNPNHIIKNVENIGIAHFGEQDPVNSKAIRAITDTNFIEQVLNIFNLERYKNFETGTRIIVPFANKEKLLKNTTNNDSTNITWWSQDVESYLKVAIFRWYFPRMCDSYKYAPKLNAFLNGIKLIPEVETTIYKKYKELYKYAFTNQNIPGWINRKEITRNTGVREHTLGTFVYGKVYRSELHNYPDPSTYASIETDSLDCNRPLICFTRRPGMIINYTSEKSIVGNIETDPNEFIIGVFVLNSDNDIIKDNIRKNLDEYIRGGEKSDHTSWSDYQIEGLNSTIRIVNKIFTGINNSLNETYGEREISTGYETISRSLGNLFGSILLPKNIGTTPRSGGGGGSSRSSKRIDHGVSWWLDYIDYQVNALNLRYEFDITKEFNEIVITTEVNSISKSYNVDEWEESSSEFPFFLNAVCFQCYEYDNKKCEPKNIMLRKDQSLNGDLVETFKYEFLKSNKGTVYGIKIYTNSPNKAAKLRLNLNLKTLNDKQYQSNIKVEVK